MSCTYCGGDSCGSSAGGSSMCEGNPSPVGRAMSALLPYARAEPAKLPIKAASNVGKEYNMDRVLLIAYDEDTETTHTVSWGRTRQHCSFAAMDIQKLRAVLEGQPTSLEEALKIASEVDPRDVGGFESK